MNYRYALAHRRFGSAAVASAVLCALLGCSTTRARPEWVQSITFWEDREVDDKILKKTPAQEIDELRATLEKVPSMTPEEQNAKARELAEAYRNESDGAHSIGNVARRRTLRIAGRRGNAT
ncbi:MAG: hypothetical protein QM775_30535 [Pirellulales bacterium]